MTQAPEGNRHPIEAEYDVLAPPGTDTHPRDRWHLPIGVCEQVGHPRDYTGGPWWPDPGVAVRVRRVEG
ncbi:MAG: hypothetical protein QM708_12075 [Propioniciclava sp.]|uniref:hypothetical protein n=1 Tax=Propioniciclava sp. TaxID=2038686 RepID=UPI0039E39FA9